MDPGLRERLEEAERAFTAAEQEWLKKLSTIHPGQLRTVGLGAMIIGLLICFVVQKTSLL